VQVAKLRAALILRMAEQGISDGAEVFADRVIKDLEQHWDVSLGSDNQVPCGSAPE